MTQSTILSPHKSIINERKLGIWSFKTSGDYITIIGDDDALMPDGLALAAELIKKPKHQYCIASQLYINGLTILS